MTMSFGGWGMQSSDPNLADKIAKLKSGKPSSKQRTADYLEREMHVDPRELRFTHNAACDRVRELLESGDSGSATLYGSSVGLKRVAVHTFNENTVDVTETDQHSQDWHDWKRVWAALVNHHQADGTTFYSFEVSANWNEVEVIPIAAKPVKKRITSYPPGTLLKIERQFFIDGVATQERLNVSVGGLFDDRGVIILSTMKPMTDLTGWTVVEEL